MDATDGRFWLFYTRPGSTLLSSTIKEKTDVTVVEGTKNELKFTCLVQTYNRHDTGDKAKWKRHSKTVQYCSASKTILPGQFCVKHEFSPYTDEFILVFGNILKGFFDGKYTCEQWRREKHMKKYDEVVTITVKDASEDPTETGTMTERLYSTPVKTPTIASNFTAAQSTNSRSPTSQSGTTNRNINVKNSSTFSGQGSGPTRSITRSAGVRPSLSTMNPSVATPAPEGEKDNIAVVGFATTIAVLTVVAL